MRWNVVLGVLRHVVVDHVRDAGDVEAARRDVGCHQDLVAAALEAFQRLDALALVAVGMHHAHGVAAAFQLVRDAIGAHAGPAENEDALEFRLLEEQMEQVEFLRRHHGIEAVRNGLRRSERTRPISTFLHGVAQGPGGQRGDFRGGSP